MPQILVNLTDATRRRVFVDGDFDRLGALGEVVRFDPSTDDPASFSALVAGADAILTGWGSRGLSDADVPSERRPLLVAHSAGSVRPMVGRELLTRGVRLTQGASAIAPAVAEFAVGCILLALRQSFARHCAGRAGTRYEGEHNFRELDGLTVGLVGLSQVGRRVPPLLAPYNCRITAFDPYCTPERAAELGVTLVNDLDDLIREADVLSLHAPVTAETQNLIDARRISLLKPGAVFVNTARPQLLDQDALFARAFRGEIEAYLDVTTPEPLPPSNEAWNCPHIFITPHIAGGSQQALRRMAVLAIDEIERFLSGQPLQTEVTYDRYELLA